MTGLDHPLPPRRKEILIRMTASPTWTRTAAGIALAGLMMTLVTGCSFSASSESSSESSSDSSRSSSDSSASSSGSSSPESKEKAYRDDVRDYAEAYVKSGGQFDAFQRRLGEIARKHDITNWEDNQATYVGIGEGLGRARVNRAQFEVWQQNLAGADPTRRASMQRGYDSQQR